MTTSADNHSSSFVSKKRTMTTLKRTVISALTSCAWELLMDSVRWESLDTMGGVTGSRKNAPITRTATTDERK